MVYIKKIIKENVIGNEFKEMGRHNTKEREKANWYLG
jgi:hypothetical protein